MSPVPSETLAPVLPLDPSDPPLPRALNGSGQREHSAADAAEAALSANPEITDDDRVSLAKELAKMALERASLERAARVARDAALAEAAVPVIADPEPIAPTPEPVVPPKPVAAAPPEPRRRSLAERAPPPMAAGKSAIQVAKSIAAPVTPAPAETPEPPKRKAAKAEAAPPPPAQPTPQRAAPAPPEPGRVVAAGPPVQRPDPTRALAVLGELEVVRAQSLPDRTVFAAVWAAHRAHALNAGDLSMAAMATVLIDAATRVPPDHLHAIEVVVGDTRWAAWVDSSRDTLLGVALVPQLWLIGT